MKLAPNCGQQQAPKSGTAIVPPGAVTLTILLTAVNDSYQFLCTPSWNTTVYPDPLSQTSSSITVEFGTLAPPGGGFLDWLIIEA